MPELVYQLAKGGSWATLARVREHELQPSDQASESGRHVSDRRRTDPDLRLTHINSILARLAFQACVERLVKVLEDLSVAKVALGKECTRHDAEAVAHGPKDWLRCQHDDCLLDHAPCHVRALAQEVGGRDLAVAPGVDELCPLGCSSHSRDAKEGAVAWDIGLGGALGWRLIDTVLPVS